GCRDGSSRPSCNPHQGDSAYWHTLLRFRGRVPRVMMTIRRRMLLLLSLLVAACLAVAAAWQGLEEYRAGLLEASARREKEMFFRSLLSLQGAALEELAVDYTCWDDLVRFVR